MAAVEPEEETETDKVREALKEEYEIITELGRGGMAIVFRAREKALDREVAVKVLPFSLAFDAEFVERFQREARTAAKLEHSHIIPIYRVGKSGRVIYFVMKFVRGQALSEMIEQRGAIPPDQIRKLLTQTAGALGYAHKNGIVHRDIKPDNIMFDESGNAIVMDFGIAKAASGTRLTGTGMSIGTPHYMSPEQARAQPLDGRSDIYSLGVVAYQCLTGSVPFDGEDSFSIGYKHIMEELPTPELQTAEQRDLFEIVRRMMAKSADERFQSAEELIAVLEGRAPVATPTLAADAPTTVMPAGDLQTTTPQAVGVSPTTPTTPMPRTQPQREPVKKKRGGVLVGMFTLLLLGGGGGGYWYYFMGPGQGTLPFGSRGSTQGEQSPPPTQGELLAAAGSTAAAVNDSGGAKDDSAAVVAQPGDTAAAAADTGQQTAATPVTTPTTTPVRPPSNNGWVRLRNLPTRGATVRIDGERKRGAIIEVPIGSRRIEVVRAGYKTFTRTVNVPRVDTVNVTVNMSREVAQPPPRQPVAPKDYCAEPGPEYNQDGSCFQTAPAATRPPIVRLPPGTQQPRQRPVLWVYVGTDGRAKEVRRQQDSDVLRCTINAQLFARDSLRYNPARKGGQPVEAWFKLPFVCRGG
jgi:serine/threonine protein kinase